MLEQVMELCNAFCPWIETIYQRKFVVNPFKALGILEVWHITAVKRQNI